MTGMVCERCGRVFENYRQYLIRGGLRCRDNFLCISRIREQNRRRIEAPTTPQEARDGG